MKTSAFILAGALAAAGVRAAERPNIVVIMADDLGYGDLSSYGGTDVRTPCIDRLIGAGLRFNQFYANCCVCSPTRAAFLTGRWPALVGIPGVIRTPDEVVLDGRKTGGSFGRLTAGAVFLPALFQQAGYHTELIGKWHLGLDEGNRPNQRGFTLFRGFLGDMMDDYLTHRRHGINYMRLNETVIDPPGHATDLFTQWAIETLRDRAADRLPFLMFLAYNAPHAPIQPPPEWLGKVQKREPGIRPDRAAIVALIEHLDAGVGEVLAALDELGLSGQTIVVFTSDNGGQLNMGASCGPLRSGKTHMYEGGLKVCTGVRWPGKIAAGRQTEFRALTMDILPTLAELCGVPVTVSIEGRSFAELLLNGEQPPFARTDYFTWFEKRLAVAVREGDWKLVRDSDTRPHELFNIGTDPYEQSDVAAQHPEKAERLRQALETALGDSVKGI